MADPRPTKVIIDCSTGERQIVELTDEEIAEREAMAAQAEAERIAQEEAATALQALKDSAKAKLVAGEPLTAEEADTLVL
jgi:hypothetical protein